MHLPKVFLNAPMGVQPYLSVQLLNKTDPKFKLGLALTYDCTKYIKSDISIKKFINQPDRFVLMYPENSKLQEKTKKYLVQTSTSWIEPNYEQLEKLNSDLLVGYNCQYPQFKQNITRDAVKQELSEMEPKFKSLVITKDF